MMPESVNCMFGKQFYYYGKYVLCTTIIFDIYDEMRSLFDYCYYGIWFVFA